MKKFEKFAAQGEIDIAKLDKLPNGVKRVEPVDGYYVIGHSETGHHHVLERERVHDVYEGTNSEGMKTFYAILKEGAELKHLRSFDTHESIGFNEGDIASFTSGEEFDHYAELARKQAD